MRGAHSHDSSSAVQVLTDMSVAVASDAMKTDFPDAPDDVLKEVSSEETVRMVICQMCVCIVLALVWCVCV